MSLILDNIWLIMGGICTIAALAINYSCLDDNGNIKGDL